MYPVNSEGLRVFRNGALAYASHPRLADHLRDKLKVVTINDTKRVVFTDPVYKNSPFLLEHWFSSELTDAEVLANAQLGFTLSQLTGLKLNNYWGH